MTKQPSGPSDEELRRLLEELDGQDPEVIGELFALLDEDLRRRAHQKMARYGPQTLQPTALVNEVYIRLVTSDAALKARTPEEFKGLIKKAMDHILTDAWRSRSAKKRGGHLKREALTSSNLPASTRGFQTLEAEMPERYRRALGRLTPRSRRMVELRRLGASVDLIAATMPVDDEPQGKTPSVRTVQRVLSRAMRILQALLLDDAPPPADPDPVTAPA